MPEVGWPRWPASVRPDVQRPQGLPEGAIFLWRKSKRSALVGGLADAMSGIAFDVAGFPCVGEHATQQAHGADGGCGPPVTRARPRGFVFTVAAVLPLVTASRKRLMSALVRSLSGFFPSRGRMWRAIRPRSISRVLAFLGKPLRPMMSPASALVRYSLHRSATVIACLSWCRCSWGPSLWRRR